MSNREPLHFYDSFRFGKYKHMLVEQVIERDPGYIAWCIENDVVEFHDDVTPLLKEKQITRRG